MPTREQLRLARTKFVHRWHAAQTIGERLGNDAVGERFEHINHARSLAEHVWRYGVFEESGDGTGRVLLSGDPVNCARGRPVRLMMTVMGSPGRSNCAIAVMIALRRSAARPETLSLASW